MNVKQQFVEVLKKLKEYTGWSYRKISELTKISQSKLKMAATGQSFNVSQKDVDLLQSILNGELNKKESTPTPNSMAQDLKEIKEMVKSQSEMVKQQYETITTKGKDIIDATIKAIAEKHNMSIEEVMISFEKMLVERLKEDQSQDTKKG